MNIEHLAIWTRDIERLRKFYEKYFSATSGSKYSNPAKQFESYFLSFPTGARLELMYKPGLQGSSPDETMERSGYIHMAFSTGSKEGVDALTTRLQQDGYPLLDGPRYTGDGYYESVILDPDGNRIEITI